MFYEKKIFYGEKIFYGITQKRKVKKFNTVKSEKLLFCKGKFFALKMKKLSKKISFLKEQTKNEIENIDIMTL
jgi:hypothetical protein